MGKVKKEGLSLEVLSNLNNRDRPYLIWFRDAYRGSDASWKPYRRYKTLEEAESVVKELGSIWPGSDFDYNIEKCDPLFMKPISENPQPVEVNLQPYTPPEDNEYAQY